MTQDIQKNADKANDNTESDSKTTEPLSAENQKDFDEASANASPQRVPENEENANKANDSNIVLDGTVAKKNSDLASANGSTKDTNVNIVITACQSNLNEEKYGSIGRSHYFDPFRRTLKANCSPNIIMK